MNMISKLPGLVECPHARVVLLSQQLISYKTLFFSFDKYLQSIEKNVTCDVC